MSYLLRGAILIATSGQSIALVDLRETAAYKSLPARSSACRRRCCGRSLFLAVSAILFNRHQFGAQVKCVGDNPDSAAQMGINTRRIRVYTFVFMGFGAALAGMFSTMINFTWWPTAGEAYLLPRSPPSSSAALRHGAASAPLSAARSAR